MLERFRKGDWFDFFTGLHYFSRRGRKMLLHRDLHTMPVLAKAGAIVPMAKYSAHNNRLFNAENMEVVVFPGADNAFTLYEDAGEHSDFERGAFAKTTMELKWGSEAEFTIHPAVGDLSLIPQTRNWTISLRGFHKDADIWVNVPGVQITRNPETNTTQVCVSADVTQAVTVRVSGEQLIHDNSDVMNRVRDIVLFSQISDKDQMMQIIREDMHVHERLLRIDGVRREWIGVAEAIGELLTLTQEEFENLPH